MIQLATSAESLRALWDYLPVGIARLSSEGRIEEANGFFEELCGGPRLQLTQRRLSDFLATEHAAALERDLEAVARGALGRCYREVAWHSADGRVQFVGLSFSSGAATPDERPTSILAISPLAETAPVQPPSTEPRKPWSGWLLCLALAEHAALALAGLRLRTRLRLESQRDPLTGLHNRRCLEECLNREIRRAIRSRSRVGVVMLDLDGFKRFNDARGHQAGDDVLRRVAAAIRARVRREDFACRYGGDEFTLVLPSAGEAETTRRAEALCADLRMHMAAASENTVTLSAGVAVFPDHGLTGPAVLRAADAALYGAKRSGRDCVVAGPT
jgi:diguanylate cyclase (GGDEF)-like protein/PAS domain S-box-containing protein